MKDKKIKKQENKKGIYRHYKGGKYRVIAFALNSETKEKEVVYQDMKYSDKIWVRPVSIFFSSVDIKKKKISRFEYISDDNNDYEDLYKRALADYQNLVKKSLEEKQEFVKYAVEQFIHEIIPVFDNLKVSIASLSREEASNPWVEGIKYVIKQFREVLEKHKVSEIETIGQKFDHHVMEAIEGKGEKVKKQVKSGYMLNGKVIMPAKVIVE